MSPACARTYCVVLFAGRSSRGRIGITLWSEVRRSCWIMAAQAPGSAGSFYGAARTAGVSADWFHVLVPCRRPAPAPCPRRSPWALRLSAMRHDPRWRFRARAVCDGLARRGCQRQYIALRQALSQNPTDSSGRLMRSLRSTTTTPLPVRRSVGPSRGRASLRRGAPFSSSASGRTVAA